MFFSSWRRPPNRNPVPPSSRPRLEPLEDRVLPALWVGGVLEFAAVPGAVSSFQPPGGPVAGAAPIRVTVTQNAPETVIDLGAVFGAMSGIRAEDGLKLSILGNTNSGLVQTDLSEAALTLTYAPGKFGTATITACATDADGVSVQQILLVTVAPLGPAGGVAVSLSPPGPQGPTTPGMPR